MKTGRVISEGLNVHSEAGASKPVKTALKRGDVVDIFESRYFGTFEWVSIVHYRGAEIVQGWVDARFLELLPEPKPLPKPSDPSRTLIYVAAIGIIGFLALIAWLF